MVKRSTENTEAYQLYLKGRYYWNGRTGELLKKANEYFQQAIDKDPSYGLSYAGLGRKLRPVHFLRSTPSKRSVSESEGSGHEGDPDR